MIQGTIIHGNIKAQTASPVAACIVCIITGWPLALLVSVGVVNFEPSEPQWDTLLVEMVSMIAL